MKSLKILSLVVVFVVLMLAGMKLRPFGELPSFEMDRYVIENSQADTGSNNAVTAVVFDYRGFDTLGEATILFTAVTGVYIAFRKLKPEKEVAK